jgi:hypothetical protein
MTSYLSYETEKREIRIVPVDVLELDLNIKNHGWQCNYSEFFRMSFLNDHFICKSHLLIFYYLLHIV